MTPEQQAKRRLANQAAHYNSRQAAAAERGPMHLVGFWYEVCRKLAKDAQEAGDPAVANRLSSHLNDFYQAHTQ